MGFYQYIFKLFFPWLVLKNLLFFDKKQKKMSSFHQRWMRWNQMRRRVLEKSETMICADWCICSSGWGSAIERSWLVEPEASEFSQWKQETDDNTSQRLAIRLALTGHQPTNWHLTSANLGKTSLLVYWCVYCCLSTVSFKSFYVLRWR